MTENNLAIFWGNGYILKGGAYSSVDKLSFTSDKVTYVNLTFDSMPDVGQAGFSNNNVEGYSVGGLEIQKLRFSNDISFAVNSKLSDARTQLGTCGSNSHGFIASGTLNKSDGSSKIDKFSFNTETNFKLNNNLFKELKDSQGFSQADTYGYFIGGEDTKLMACTDDITKLMFSNDSLSILKSSSTSRKCGTATTENLQHGIIAGGNMAVTIIQKLCFSTECNTNMVIYLQNKDRINSTALGYRNRGFIMGGRNDNQNIECIEYRNECIGYIESKISEKRDKSHGFENRG